MDRSLSKNRGKRGIQTGDHGKMALECNKNPQGWFCICLVNDIGWDDLFSYKRGNASARYKVNNYADNKSLKHESKYCVKRDIMSDKRNKSVES